VVSEVPRHAYESVNRECTECRGLSSAVRERTQRDELLHDSPDVINFMGAKAQAVPGVRWFKNVGPR
jgi:hypothetical protein